MAGSYVFPPDDHPDSPWPIFERVLDLAELAVQASLVREHAVLFAFAFRYDSSDGGWTRGERMLLGTAQMPRVTGALSDLFDQLLQDTLGFDPHFLILLNGDWWADANDQEREILVVHELMHCGQALDQYGAPKFRKSDNAPILAMIGHDVEEFEAVVRRYGAWKSDLVAFKRALDDFEGPPGNGAPPLDVFLEIAPETPVSAPPVASLTDADLPPNVTNADRDIPPQDESAADLF